MKAGKGNKPYKYKGRKHRKSHKAEKKKDKVNSAEEHRKLF